MSPRVAKSGKGRSSPAVTFLPYQLRWLKDDSRLKLWVASRQIGKSFAVSFEAVEHSLRTGQPWLMMSRSWPQTIELLDKCKRHAKAFNLAYEELEGETVFDEEGKAVKVREIRFGRGRIVGAPANPETARSWSANVVLDEFDFHRHQKPIWQAALGSALRGYRVRAVSTPNGKLRMLYKLLTDEKNGFSKHSTTIFQAVEDGLVDVDGKPIDIEELRRACGDEATFLQEFCCEFLDEALAWITFELISAAETDLAWTTPKEGWSPKGRLFGGYDVARKKHLAVIWIWERIGDVLWTRAVEELPKKKYAEQETAAAKWLKNRAVRRFAIDATGMGGPVAERLKDRFRSRVEEVTFDLESKEEMADLMREAFEERRVRIPISQDIRQDLQSVKRFTTGQGRPRFDAAGSDLHGHGDRFWAAGLGMLAAKRSNRGEIGVSVA